MLSRLPEWVHCECGYEPRVRWYSTTTSAPEVGAESFLYARGRIKVHHAFGRLFIYVNPNDELRDPSVRCATPVKLRWDAQRRGATDPR